APAPSAASSCPAGNVTTPGITSNQSRTTRKNDPLITSADNIALAAAGAPAWAGGSHRCNGKNAVLARSPVVVSAAAAQATGSGGTRVASSGMSSVTYAP